MSKTFFFIYTKDIELAANYKLLQSVFDFVLRCKKFSKHFTDENTNIFQKRTKQLQRRMPEMF